MSDLSAIIEELDGLTVTETNDLVKRLEDKWHVSARTQASVVSNAPVLPVAQEPAKTAFDVTLKESGPNKITVIKEVRAAIPGIGLKEAKDLVDGAPKLVVQGVAKDVAEALKAKLEAAGAKVSLE